MFEQGHCRLHAILLNRVAVKLQLTLPGLAACRPGPVLWLQDPGTSSRSSVSDLKPKSFRPDVDEPAKAADLHVLNTSRSGMRERVVL
jgi:hypothetical protein